MSAAFLRMGFERRIALLMLLIILNFGMSDAARQCGEDVQRVPNVAPFFTDLGGKYDSRADSSLKIGSKGVVMESGMATKKGPREWESWRARRLMIGSAAPECGRTCGACAPCEMQVVSYECSEALEPHAEACPLGYLCTCHGRSFPIP